MILLALSICSLFDLTVEFVFWFTLVFSVCGYALVIYLKLKLALDEEECKYIIKVLNYTKEGLRRARTRLISSGVHTGRRGAASEKDYLR